MRQRNRQTTVGPAVVNHRTGGQGRLARRGEALAQPGRRDRSGGGTSAGRLGQPSLPTKSGRFGEPSLPEFRKRKTPALKPERGLKTNEIRQSLTCDDGSARGPDRPNLTTPSWPVPEPAGHTTAWPEKQLECPLSLERQILRNPEQRCWPA